LSGSESFGPTSCGSQLHYLHLQASNTPAGLLSIRLILEKIKTRTLGFKVVVSRVSRTRVHGKIFGSFEHLRIRQLDDSDLRTRDEHLR
jgi:hypothetical protein